MHDYEKDMKVDEVGLGVAHSKWNNTTLVPLAIITLILNTATIYLHLQTNNALLPYPRRHRPPLGACGRACRLAVVAR